jgi:hypothetical protein
MSDWRLQGQAKYLAGVPLRRERYCKRREDWEHDHCEFCMRKFSERPGDAHEGYVTEDDYHWICEDCYEDFKGQFQWVVKGNDSGGKTGGEEQGQAPN